MLNEKDLNKLYQYSYSLTSGGDQAYDLVHEAIISMQGKFVLNKMAYAKRVIRNKFYDQYKKIKKEETFVEEYADEVDWEYILISKDELKNIMGKLNAEDRELLYLIFVDEYTYKEISQKIRE